MAAQYIPDSAVGDARSASFFKPLIPRRQSAPPADQFGERRRRPVLAAIFAGAVMLDLSAYRRPPYRGAGTSCLRIAATAVSPEEAAESVAESSAGQAFSARHTEWAERLPERDALWDWLRELLPEDRGSLFAHCVGMTVDALQDGHRGDGGQEQAGRFAAALGLDMRLWWRPTQANFLSRITKTGILTAVSEGVSQQAAWRLAGLKKDRMAKEAEKLLANSAWLPLPLRSPVLSGDV